MLLVYVDLSSNIYRGLAENIDSYISVYKQDSSDPLSYNLFGDTIQLNQSPRTSIINDFAINYSGDIFAVSFTDNGLSTDIDNRTLQKIYKYNSTADKWNCIKTFSKYAHEKVAINNSGNIVAFRMFD